MLETKRLTRIGDTNGREADIGIVAATNRDLVKMVAAGEPGQIHWLVARGSEDDAAELGHRQKAREHAPVRIDAGALGDRRVHRRRSDARELTREPMRATPAKRGVTPPAALRPRNSRSTAATTSETCVERTSRNPIRFNLGSALVVRRSISSLPSRPT